MTHNWEEFLDCWGIHVHLEALYNPSFISSQLKEVGEIALKSNISLSLLCIGEISPRQPPAHLIFSVSLSGINILPRLSFLNIAKLTASDLDAHDIL